MATKRKRASFTINPPDAFDTPEETKNEQDKEPVMKQVVEVVVKDDRKDKSKPAPVNIVIPPQQVVVSQDSSETEDELPVVDGVDGLTEETFTSKAHEFVEALEDDDDEETVTASATPEGDTVLVRENNEDEFASEPSIHQVINDTHTSQAKDEAEQLPEAEEEDVASTSSNEQITPVVPPPMKVHGAGHTHDTVNEKQQEQVAELFSKNSHTTLPEITVHKQTQTKGVILWAITMIAIALGVGGGLVLFTTRNSTPTPPAVESSPTPQQTISPTVAVTPTPTAPAITKKTLKIQVLNGGGKAGAGSKMKAFLEENGYSVNNVGNASSYTYEQTEIVVKAEKASAATVLAQELATEYDMGDVKTTLPESSTYDLQVIVGAND